MIRYSLEVPRAQRALDTRPFHQYTLDDGTVWTEFHRVSDGYLLRFPDLADFEVSASGEDVVAHPATGTDEATIEHLYINQLVPLALSRQGRPAFHASVVTVPGGAVAFLGKSGRGKSTLAASFALEDATFLTDDALIIDESNGIRAIPSHASLRLWEDSVEALMQDSRQQDASYTCFSNKARLFAGDALRHTDTPLPLLAAYILGDGEPEDITIEELHGTKRHIAWVENSFLLDIKDKDLLARHFEWTHRISGQVPTYSLDYVRDYGMLAEVRKAITNHSNQLT